MTTDLVCVGRPFLDLVFRGLASLPVPGEELLARELVIVPGAMANVAYAAQQLGLTSAVCAPISDDPAGRFLQQLMAEAGIRWVGRRGGRTPVTVSLPAYHDRAFVTVDPSDALDLSPIEQLAPRAVVIGLPIAERVAGQPMVYGAVGDPEVRELAGAMPASLAALRALIVNEREVIGLAGMEDSEDAARHLASLGTTVVVTCADAGAFATEPSGRTVRVGTLAVDVPDPTGAGDLFLAAYIWADLAGRELERRLELATAYASRSLAAAGTGPKGITLAEFASVMGDQEAADMSMEVT